MPPRLCRNNDNLESDKSSGPIEGDMNRFEKALKTKFEYLRNTGRSNLAMVKKCSLSFIRNQKDLMIILSNKN